MTNEEFTRQVEAVIRRSEVIAVVKMMKTGRKLRLGEILDYSIEPPPELELRSVVGRNARDRYQFTVEPFHLEQASALLRQVSNGRNGHSQSRP